MPKVKPKRSVPSIDMTAMVDVAFLLLTFFILTTRFKADEQVVVDTPSSTGSIEIEVEKVVQITVDKDGRVFFGVGVPAERESILNKVRSRYGNFPVSEDGMKFFKNLPNFGIPINQVSGWLSLSPEQMKEFPQPGIPVNTKKGQVNELKEWLLAARRTNPDLPIAVKGDNDVPYTVMEKVIFTLQDIKINKFNLITNAEEDPNAAKAKEAAENSGE